ncbi:hypothetical protein AB0G60_11930 [Streptomyces angustmyceticus]|uniref:DUF11 domain-containing protein n=1 Tax=Streptomyces angustmyceticus TaxID=285578 RepID=A0A5J4LBX4_9ACTN|nr:hypothetical protein [Streptomyces angustmyceticus]UAL68225.1 hypothetical protein K7396_18255 [Streptomyces angustmyceticus]GES31673.1 hypothetical protein San01_41600 [Streptomyces angustmyceticus]
MRTAVVCALLCAAALPGPSAAYAAQAPPAARHAPQAPPAVSVTVAVTDGRDDAEAGRRLDYRITVHNLGATTVRGARIEQEMPATTVSATAPGATVEGRGEREQKAVWRADLPAHDIQVFTASAVLGDRTGDTGSAAPGTLRAASTVCVYVGGSYAPTACSGDLDDLPETRAQAASGGGWVGWAVAAAVTALFGPGVVRAVRRRRAPQPR